MASRLSSLLVRDGLVGVKRMEKAFQRQVIYGGSLDTTLLEMGLVSEDRLTQYLALTSGLPPATRAEMNVFDAEAIRRCPEDVAHKFRVVPLCLEDGALRVLVHDPVDVPQLEDLADVLDLPVQPLIAPEYRWHVLFARTFGALTPARFATLAKQAEGSPATSPVGRARSVIVERDVGESSPDHVVVDVKGLEAASATPLAPVGPDQPTMRFTAAVPDPTDPEITPPEIPKPRTRTAELSTPALTRHLDDTEHARKDAERKRGSGPNQAPASDDVADGVPRVVEVAADPPRLSAAVPIAAARTRNTLPGVMAPVAAERAATSREATDDDVAAVAPVAPVAPVEATPAIPTAPMPATTTPAPTTSEPARPVARRRTAPHVAVPVLPGDSPISPVDARDALAAAEDRDAIFSLLLRALRGRCRWAGLLTVQGGAAIGRLALAEPGLDAADVSAILIPLDSPSAFAAILGTQLYHLGPIATGDRDIDGMLARMGGAVPPIALLLPIVLRERVVAIAIGHKLDQPLGLAEVAELLPLADVAAEAVGRLIVRQKSIGYRAPTPLPVPVVEIDGGELPTKRVERAAASWSVPADAPSVPELDDHVEHGTELSMTAEPARPIVEVLAQIEGSDETAADHAIVEAVERGNEVLPLLRGRFPGRLRVDRYQVSGRALRAAQYGGILDLVVRLGSPVADLLVEKMGDASRDIRFYATVCAAELRPRNAMYALVERLFDADYGVRACAIEALAGYPVRDLDLAMVRARHALHSEDPERVLASSTAIADLGDVHAIPDLLDTVGRDNKRAEHARRALAILTKQDFGTSERKWRKWWEDNKKRHRIEWLIDGLAHKDAALRQTAIEDLRKLTGEYFGYYHDQPKKDREAAAARWQRWWTDTGKRRFVRDDDERNRPTAVLPQVRKD